MAGASCSCAEMRPSRAVSPPSNARATTVEVPGVNHLFQRCKTGSPSEYAQIEETFAPAALKVVGEWVVSVTR